MNSLPNKRAALSCFSAPLFCLLLAACDQAASVRSPTAKDSTVALEVSDTLPPPPALELSLLQEGLRVLNAHQLDWKRMRMAEEVEPPIIVLREQNTLWHLQPHEGEWQLLETRPVRRKAVALTAGPGAEQARAAFYHPHMRFDGTIFLPATTLSAKSEAEFIADFFHEWAHWQQWQAGWDFRAAAQNPCLFRVQEGEARAWEIDLARAASGDAPWRQAVTPVIDYGALYDNLLAELDEDHLEGEQSTERYYHEGARSWRSSDLTPAAWRETRAAYCADKPSE